jgi:hypothetical protein
MLLDAKEDATSAGFYRVTVLLNVVVWPKAIVAFLQRMAGAADIIEHELTVRRGAFSGRILPKRIGADDCEGSKR